MAVAHSSPKFSISQYLLIKLKLQFQLRPCSMKHFKDITPHNSLHTEPWMIADAQAMWNSFKLTADANPT